MRSPLSFRTAAVALTVAIAFSGCRSRESESSETPLPGKTAARTVQLFYEGADGLLRAEPRTLQLPESDEAAVAPVLVQLMRGPANAQSVRCFPADAVLRAAYLLPEGTAVIDVGGPTLAAGWNTGSHAEMMALYSVVQTVTANFRGARRVRMLVNGVPAETLAGHIRIDQPLVPDTALLRR